MSNIKIIRVDSLRLVKRFNGVVNNVLSYIWMEAPHLDSGTILGGLGIYGVSIFFILSGLCKAIVYNSPHKSFYNSF